MAVPVVEAAVVGVGNFGRRHALKYAGMHDVRLVGVCDVDRARAEDVAAECAMIQADPIMAWDDAAQIPEGLAVSVCTPTDTHALVGQTIMRRSCATLIEKPLALSIGAAYSLFRASQGRLAAVGYIERFNPVICWGLQEWLRSNRDGIQTVAGRRFGPGPDMPLAHLAADLLTHDVDLLRYLLGREPLRAKGSLERGMAAISVQFEGGMRAELQAGRAEAKERTLGFIGLAGVAFAGLLHEVGHVVPRAGTSWRCGPPYPQSGGDALARELAAFIASAQTGVLDRRLATPRDGLIALWTASAAWRGDREVGIAFPRWEEMWPT